MKDKTYTLKGELALAEHGDEPEILFAGRQVVSEWAAEILGKEGHHVTVRYWLCPHKMTKEEAEQAFIETLFGVGEGLYRPHYSEITGYLWTDEEFLVGGHNMLDRLESGVGKYLILEMVVHHAETKT